ncbi:hypothetical protein FF2_040599 [Malus domestica]
MRVDRGKRGRLGLGFFLGVTNFLILALSKLVGWLTSWLIGVEIMMQRAFGANDVMKHVLDWFWVIAEESTFGNYVRLSDLWVEGMSFLSHLGCWVAELKLYSIEARTIKWKLCLTWGTGVKNPFYLDHFGHHWYAVEFSDQEELEYVLDNRPWYVQIPRLSVQYRDAEILEVIMQPVGTFIRADENSLSGLNGLFVRVLLEVDLRLPLKRVMVIIDEEDISVLLSYEKLSKVCFYCGRRRSEGHKCSVIKDRDGWLLVDRLFEDELLVYSAGVEISEETRQKLHRGNWYDNVVRGNKTWVLKADLMSKWMLDCTLSSGATVRGGAKIAANVDKGKNTMEEDEEFMKAEKENNE